MPNKSQFKAHTDELKVNLFFNQIFICRTCDEVPQIVIKLATVKNHHLKVSLRNHPRVQSKNILENNLSVFFKIQNFQKV